MSILNCQLIQCRKILASWQVSKVLCISWKRVVDFRFWTLCSLEKHKPICYKACNRTVSVNEALNDKSLRLYRISTYNQLLSEKSVRLLRGLRIPLSSSLTSNSRNVYTWANFIQTRINVCVLISWWDIHTLSLGYTIIYQPKRSLASQ
jgi:hypothetical protein